VTIHNFVVSYNMHVRNTATVLKLASVLI